MEDKDSRRRRQIRTSYIFFTILFTVIIISIVSVCIAFKQETESELLSASSSNRAIHAACNLTPNPRTCFHSIWSLHENSSSSIDSDEIKITPSRIFALSLRSVINQLEDSISANQKAISEVKDSRTLSDLKGCDFLFKKSLRLVNSSYMMAMGMNPYDKLFIKEGILNSRENLDKCLAGSRDDSEEWMNFSMFRMKVFHTRGSLDNSLVILEKMDKIPGKFDKDQPIFGAIFEYGYLFRGSEFNLGFILYYLQFLFLIVLVCMVLRL